MVATRYSNQHRLKPRQNAYYCQVQPPDNIENLSASRRCLWVRMTVSTSFRVLPLFKNQNNELQRRLPGVLPIQQGHQKLLKKNFWLHIEGLHEDKLCGTLQAAASTNVKTVHGNLLTPIREQPRSIRTVVANPQPGFSATKRTNHAPTSFGQ